MSTAGPQGGKRGAQRVGADRALRRAVMHDVTSEPPNVFHHKNNDGSNSYHVEFEKCKKDAQRIRAPFSPMLHQLKRAIAIFIFEHFSHI